MEPSGLLSIIIILCSFLPRATAVPNGLAVRQVASTSASVANPTSPVTVAVTTSSLPNADNLITSQNFSSSSASDLSTSSISSSSPKSANHATINTTTSDDAALPIRPKISPPNILTGIVLIISGLIYSYISIKYEIAHNALSVGFAISLAITVGATPAQRSGFVVGAIIGGLIVGGLSTPFREMTEGIGCFLAGFCLSMWFLCLKSGGLINNNIGKIVFIVAMTICIGGLGLWKPVRKRALIGCIPLSGATALLLGVDCFTCAGLKEFWLYIWALNADLFPENISTYPLARAIKIELAAIIVAWIIGIVINWKIWLKQHNKQLSNDGICQHIRRQREALETVIGKRTEHIVAREKMEWEKQYNKAYSDPEKQSQSQPSRESKDIARPYSRDSDQSSEKPQDSIRATRLELAPANYAPIAVHGKETDESATAVPGTTERQKCENIPTIKESQPLSEVQVSECPRLSVVSIAIQAANGSPQSEASSQSIMSSGNLISAGAIAEAEDTSSAISSSASANSSKKFSHNQGQVASTVCIPLYTSPTEPSRPSCLRISTIASIEEEGKKDEGNQKTVQEKQWLEPNATMSHTLAEYALRHSQSAKAQVQQYRLSRPSSKSRSRSHHIPSQPRPVSQHLPSRSRPVSQHLPSRSHSFSQRPSSLIRSTSQPFLNRQSSSPLIDTLNPEFDSHQPHRREHDPSTEERAAVLANWRNSLEMRSAQPVASQNRRSLLLQNKREQDWHALQQQASQQELNAVTDLTMRSPLGLARHSQMLSKMQSQVKF